MVLKNKFYDPIGVVKEFAQERVRLFSMWSVVYPATLVASGAMVAEISKGRPWDLAAVKVIVEEAGGKVTDLLGNEQRYDEETQGAIISNGLVHDKLLKIIKTNWIDQ